MYNIELREELTDLQAQLIKDVVKLADKHGVDRDELLEAGVFVLSVMSGVATLAEYKKGGMEND